MMTGLDKIKEKILSDARADADATLAAAEAEATRIRGEWDARIEKLRAESEQAADAEVKNVLARAASSAENLHRNVVLEKRASLVDDAFRGALEDIHAMAQDEYEELLLSLLETAVCEQIQTEETAKNLGYEDAGNDAFVVLLNGTDLQRFGQRLLPDLRRNVVGKPVANELSRLTVAEKPVPIDGGLILKCGDVEINCSLSMIFSTIRAGLEPAIEKTLFDD